MLHTESGVATSTQSSFVDVYLRPGLQDFLKRLSPYYRIVVFTAATKSYADVILDHVDQHGLVEQRFYRHNCMQVHGTYIKDLAQVCKRGDIDRAIIIDNLPENFSLQKQNGMSWQASRHFLQCLFSLRSMCARPRRHTHQRFSW